MGHNLNFNDLSGEYAFFSAKEKAWHGLGQIVDQAQTSEEAIKLAHLDFEVAKFRNHVLWSDIEGSIENIDLLHDLPTPSYSTVRTDTLDVLGTVGKEYEVVQNVEAFNFIDSLVGSGEAIFETAGALGNGETIFITCKLPDTIAMPSFPDDLIEQYLLLRLSHDGSSAVKVVFTPIRVVCNNTLDMAMANKKSFVSFKHTANVRNKMDQARKMIDLARDSFKATVESYEGLAKIKVHEQAINRYVAKLFMDDKEFTMYKQMCDTIDNQYLKPMAIDAVSTRKRNIMRAVIDYYYLGVGQQTDSCKHTAYGLYNAITGYYNNVHSYNKDGVVSAEKRFESITDGFVKNLSMEALRLALTLIPKTNGK